MDIEFEEIMREVESFNPQYIRDMEAFEEQQKYNAEKR